VTAITLSAQGDNGMCAIVEGGSCASRMMCWGTATPASQNSASCVDLSNLPGNYKSYSFNGGTSGLTAKAISGGWNHMCALLSNDQLACWGENTQNVISSMPKGSLPAVAQVASASYSTCILPKPLGSAKAQCWGNAGNFQGLSSLSFNPVLTTSHGYSHCLADNDGTVSCIGGESQSGSWGFTSNQKIRSEE